MPTPAGTQRRSLLVAVGSAAVAAPFGLRFPGTAQAAARPAAAAPESAWSDLARQVSGGVLRRGDSFYFDTARPSNLRFDRQPAGIARCVTEQDVLACIAWVRKHPLDFAVRSGGHNYAGLSATRGLLIDLSPMSGVEVVDAAAGTVKVKGGTLNHTIYRELERQGRTLTHGRCDRVGAAGFLLGGGIGFNMRRFGLGSDHMLATTVATADGELVTAGPQANADLFWACQGGAGGNFGINTSFTLKTHPAQPVTAFKLTWTRDVEAVLHQLLTGLARAPDELGSKISVTMPASGTSTVSVLGQWAGGHGQLPAVFGAAWDLACTRQVLQDVPYWVAQDFLSESTYPYHYQEKSSYMKAEGITPELVGRMLGWARRMPGTSMDSVFKFFQVGGRINALRPDETAYVHRGHDWLFDIEVNWAPRDSPMRVNENLDWQQRFFSDICARSRAAGSFQNFSDPSLVNWQDAYYGLNYPRLQRVKRQVDQAQLFRHRQSIVPA
jgi:FAD/FMN-containing dehydrogenase